MGRNPPKPLDGSKYNVWVVVELANSYYETSTICTARLPETIEALTTQGFFGVASATNRILALELYLKALLIGQGSFFPRTHDLVTLFNELPEFIRHDVERMYAERMRTVERGPNWSLAYFFTQGTIPTPAIRERAERMIPTPDDSLVGLLERNKEGFVLSRYLFQDAEYKEAGAFNYEHRALAVLCGILCEGLEHSMQGQNPGYKRRFQFEQNNQKAYSPDYGNRSAYGTMDITTRV